MAGAGGEGEGEGEGTGADEQDGGKAGEEGGVEDPHEDDIDPEADQVDAGEVETENAPIEEDEITKTEALREEAANDVTEDTDAESIGADVALPEVQADENEDDVTVDGEGEKDDGVSVKERIERFEKLDKSATQTPEPEALDDDVTSATQDDVSEEGTLQVAA